MITLGQFVQSQHPGINKDPYGYKIVNLLSLFESSKEGNKYTDLESKFDELYQSPESFPEELLNKQIYHIEPTKGKTGRLFLRIILI